MTQLRLGAEVSGELSYYSHNLQFRQDRQTGMITEHEYTGIQHVNSVIIQIPI